MTVLVFFCLNKSSPPSRPASGAPSRRPQDEASESLHVVPQLGSENKLSQKESHLPIIDFQGVFFREVNFLPLMDL